MLRCAGLKNNRNFSENIRGKTLEAPITMRMFIPVLAICANLGLAEWNAIFQGRDRLEIGRELLARQSDSDCTIESTCSECYGSGYVLCSNAGCFNPSLHQQCCADGCMYQIQYQYFSSINLRALLTLTSLLYCGQQQLLW